MPAKVEVLESHRGAETMPVAIHINNSFQLSPLPAAYVGLVTILDQDVEALLDRQGGIEFDEPEA